MTSESGVHVFSGHLRKIDLLAIGFFERIEGSFCFSWEFF